MESRDFSQPRNKEKQKVGSWKRETNNLHQPSSRVQTELCEGMVRIINFNRCKLKIALGHIE